MAFSLLSQTLRWFLTGFCSLKDWIGNALIWPLSRLIHWPTFRDVEARPQHDNQPNERGHGKIETDGTVLKAPFPGAEMEDNILDIAKEASIYNRIGPHERLVRILGHSRDGLTYLRAHGLIPMDMRLKWAGQIAQAVALLHGHGIIHCDIKPRNILLDAALDIKIIDFSGSSVDGSKPADPPTVATDLFALGSTLYEVFQGASPYKEIPSDQVTDLFKRREFPDVSSIPCGEIIKQSWLFQAESAKHVQAFIQDVIRSKLNANYTPHLDGPDIVRGAVAYLNTLVWATTVLVLLLNLGIYQGCVGLLEKSLRVVAIII
ncbi:kinase-like domain-containing protein [Aspergillus carlsbadensis]|nr:kinase-like domain-containing protein [Aspergillus carlsbadensis]